MDLRLVFTDISSISLNLITHFNLSRSIKCLKSHKLYTTHVVMIREFHADKIPKPPQNKLWNGVLPTNYKFLDVEIGCGVGFHPIFYAAQNPDRYLIAIEKTTEKFDKFERRHLNHGLVNVVPVHGNAVAWITHYIELNSVDRYFILYPNPYPKDPQKRFFQMPFMKHLLATLKKGGTLTLATNEEFYYKESLELGVSFWNLKVLEDNKVDPKENPRTHFEKKYLLRGETCFNLVFEKT